MYKCLLGKTRGRTNRKRLVSQKNQLNQGSSQELLAKRQPHFFSKSRVTGRILQPHDFLRGLQIKPPLYSWGILAVKIDQEQATMASYGKYVLLRYRKKVQDLMLKFKDIMNAKEGSHSVLNYKGFLMFSFGKHLRLLCQHRGTGPLWRPWAVH